MVVHSDLAVAANPGHSMTIGSTEIIMDVMIIMAGFADLVQNTLQMLLDVVELSHGNSCRLSLGFEEVAGEFVLSIRDLADVGLEATLNFDDREDFFGDYSTDCALLLRNVDGLAEVGFETKGAAVVREGVGLIGIDDIFELCVFDRAASRHSTDETFGFLDIASSFKVVELDGGGGGDR